MAEEIAAMRRNGTWEITELLKAEMGFQSSEKSRGRDCEVFAPKGLPRDLCKGKDKWISLKYLLQSQA